MIVVIMGVTGAGKTTIGTLLARQLRWTFADADDFHSPANKRKMAKGIGLTDADRAPWLRAIHDAIVKWQAEGQSAVLACSALKHAYRKLLREGVNAQFVYLHGDAQLILNRLKSRSGHYATGELVASQFAALEEPQDAFAVDIGPDPEAIVKEIRTRLKLA